jgi:LPXTG-site transpeptidase (sortase) family protein
MPKHRAADNDATTEIGSLDLTVEMAAVVDQPPAAEDDRPPGPPRPAVPVQPGGWEPDGPVPGRAARVGRGVARGTGELLITLGVVLLLFVGYQLYGRTGMINDHQRDLDRRLAQTWARPSAAPTVAPVTAPSGPPPPAAAAGPLADGDSIGRLYIPRLKLDWVMVEGVSMDDLRGAPGHYPGTALPGQVGNFAAAGHRERGMFWDLDEVQPGDFVIMETRTNWYVYKIFQNHIVTPHSIEVIAPTPNKPGVAPTQADITLTTCNPKWDNYQRLVVHGTLLETTTHDKRPSQLED